MCIKLIAFDLDGTFLKNDKTISSRNLESIFCAARQGVWIVPATGRIFEGMPEEIRSLPFVRYVIAINGAEIRDVMENRILHRAELTREESEAVFRYTEKFPAICGCYQGGKGFMETAEFENMEAAVRWLEGQEGKILLTTGTKDLETFRSLKDFEERVYARVLPAVKSLEICLSLGLKGRHIIAMQGPFSAETNLSQLREFDCRFLVTKNTGSQGGYSQKLEAAKTAGAISLVIGRPEEEKGLSLEETLEAWSRWREKQTGEGKQEEKQQAKR